MIATKECPRRWGPAAGADTILQHGSPFPVCRLRHAAVIDDFLPECPLAAVSPMEALLKLKETAFAEMVHTVAGRESRVTELFVQYDCCERCVGENLAHPVIRRLRQQEIDGASLSKCRPTVDRELSSGSNGRVWRHGRRVVRVR